MHPLKAALFRFRYHSSVGDWVVESGCASEGGGMVGVEFVGLSALEETGFIKSVSVDPGTLIPAESGLTCFLVCDDGPVGNSTISIGIRRRSGALDGATSIGDA